MTRPTDKMIYLTALGLNKSLRQAIIDGDLSGGGGGSTLIEVFNATVLMSSNSSTLTGIAYFKAPQAMSITSVVMQIFDKGSIVIGSLTVDLKKNTTPDTVGMASIFTTLPTTDFAVNANYATDTGTLNAGAVALGAGDWIRLDVTSIPVGLGKFFIRVYGA